MVQDLLMLVSVHLDYGFVLLIQVGIHFHYIRWFKWLVKVVHHIHLFIRFLFSIWLVGIKSGLMCVQIANECC